MNNLTYYFVGLIGVWMLQDGIASICFYPSEKWRWNHAIRVIRSIMGLALIIMSGIAIT